MPITKTCGNRTHDLVIGWPRPALLQPLPTNLKILDLRLSQAILMNVLERNKHLTETSSRRDLIPGHLDSRSNSRPLEPPFLPFLKIILEILVVSLQTH